MVEGSGCLTDKNDLMLYMLLEQIHLSGEVS